MKIIKIDRGSVVVEINGKMLRILGEATTPVQLQGSSEYVIYKNSLIWLDEETIPELDFDELITFLKNEFLKRNLLLFLE